MVDINVKFISEFSVPLLSLGTFREQGDVRLANAAVRFLVDLHRVVALGKIG